MELKSKLEKSKVSRGVVVFAIVALATTLGGSFLCAILENNGKIDEGSRKVCAMIIQSVTVIVSAFAAGGGGRGIGASLLWVISYFAALCVVTIVCFGGEFASLISGAVSAAIGLAVVLVVKLFAKKQSVFGKRKVYPR